jgi:hypothetical protein
LGLVALDGFGLDHEMGIRAMDSGQPNTCEICGMLHAGDADHKHLAYHHKFLASGLRLGYYPEPYEGREERRKRGNRLINESAALNDQVFGALQVVRAFFDRSLDAAIDNEYWSEHPSFEEFAGMIGDDFPAEVLAVIRRRFGCKAGLLDDGNYWKPTADPNR